MVILYMVILYMVILSDFIEMKKKSNGLISFSAEESINVQLICHERSEVMVGLWSSFHLESPLFFFAQDPSL